MAGFPHTPPPADATMSRYSRAASGVQSVTVSHTIRYASLTDVGIKRSHNQDACSAQPAADEKHFRTVGHVFVVADGMGGHAVGEKASAKAVRDIPLTFQKHVPGEGPEASIRRAFTEANAGIHQIGTNNPEFKGLGTTSTALVLRPEGAWIGHVGDSRAYRMRGGQLEQLTFDHSWVWEIAKRQGVDPDMLGDFKRNVIIRSLGPEAEVEVDIEGPHPVEPGDAFLMCSDGLTNHVRPDEIGAVMTAFPPVEACAFLVELANLRGGSDNITCLIVQIPRGDGTSEVGTRPAKKVSGLAAAVRWWGEHVTWPPTLMAVGGGLVGLSIWMRMEQIPGVVVAFVLAAVLILAGLGGLALQLRRKVDSGAGEGADTNRELHVYKTHPFEVEKDLYERFRDLEATALKSMEEEPTTFDRAAHQKLTAAAEAKLKAGDWLAAFRARCQALQFVAIPLNRRQQKSEEFKPNWTTPQKSLGG